MKSIKCPHCKRKIIAVKLAHEQSKAIRAVLRAARKPQPIGKLARTYFFKAYVFGYVHDMPTSIQDTYMRSARRAIERLAKDGYLTRIKPGIYKTK